MYQFIGKSEVPYVSVEEAAHILRVSKWTIYRNIQQIPHVKVGNVYRINVIFLGLVPPVIKGCKTTYEPEMHYQLPLPFDIKPQRRWRNNHQLVALDPFGDALTP
jgi:excisionase family DNA binding protein